MITTEEITKSYGRNLVLRGITFCAAADEITLLVGPNGAGKSTTIKVLAGLIRPNSGNARINKIDIVAHRIGAQRSLAYLPQRPSFHPRMTCAEILRFYARLRGVAASRYEAVLDLAGLRDFEKIRTQRAFRRHASTARPGLVAFAGRARVAARRTGPESRSGLAQTTARDASF